MTAAVTVLALWSAPRARSTAFFRSVLERGDVLALHEPFGNLVLTGATDVGGDTVASASELLAWLRTRGGTVLFKDTTDHRYPDVLADTDFLATCRHTFLVRRPDEIAASFAAVQPELTEASIGLAGLHELYRAAGEAGGLRVVVDSDDLVARPADTMAAWCDAVGLPFLPDALSWRPGERAEWQRSAQWHEAVGSSSAFAARPQRYERTVHNDAELARLARQQQPHYDALHAARLRLD